MHENQVRWGILSTASIAYKTWQAIQLSGNSVLTAVASRDISRSQSFIDKCQSTDPYATKPKAYGSYEEILADKDIDAVYIPLPTGLRKEWVIRAAEAGKHIVCEKPCAISLDDLKEMVAACHQNNVQFMDGVMFMHSNRLQKIREVLDDDKSVGKIRRITSQQSYAAPEDFLQNNIRLQSNLEPQGSLGDLGWYNIRFALWAMNWELPQSVTAQFLSVYEREDSPDPVPTEFTGELFFANGVSSSFYCSFITENQQWANISGTKGYLHIDDFVLPFHAPQTTFEHYQSEFVIKDCDCDMHKNNTSISVAEHGNSAPDSQESHLYRNFSTQILSGKLNLLWPQIALQTQQVSDACMQSALNKGQPIHPNPRTVLKSLGQD
ncbi:MAG: Gfo/Idh/MocA family oxidoreductase [Opitutaceae bacterium]|nr:Gfo/Idh/MocA family oxidoreductase [Opitutaceae bacterium]